VSEGEKKQRGTGLGLYIVKYLCEKMNGDIRVFSKYEEGTVFTFCIPVNAHPSSA